MAECNYINEGWTVDFTPTSAVSAGQVVQLRDGRAAFCPRAIAAGVRGAAQVKGIVSVAKTATMVMLPSNKLFWDASANKAHLLHGGDADFYLGVCMDDAASADTTVKVNLNEQPAYTLALRDGYQSIPVSTAGWPHVYGGGNSFGMKFDLAAEAQKLDALSSRALATASCTGILSALICVNVAPDDAAVDINVGLADGTHATDADSITNSLFVHLDGNDTNIDLESDNVTAEVSATDSTVDWVAGTPFLVTFDLRTLSDIQVYIDGVNVLPNSTFTLSGAAGPLRLLAHMEKSANDSPGNVTVLDLGFTTFDPVDE